MANVFLYFCQPSGSQADTSDAARGAGRAMPIASVAAEGRQPSHLVVEGREAVDGRIASGRKHVLAVGRRLADAATEIQKYIR